MFYDMKKEVVVCPKCSKNLSLEDELEFIKKKKKAEINTKDSQLEDLSMDDGVVDLAESEMFFDMESDETSVSKTNYYSDEEEDY